MRPRATQLTLGDVPVTRSFAPPSAGRPRCTKTPAPWRAVGLSVDTAAHSGWAVALEGQLVTSGELDTTNAVAVCAVVARSAMLATIHKFPFALALEAPWGGSVAVVAALGAARERWERAWRDAGDNSPGAARRSGRAWARSRPLSSSTRRARPWVLLLAPSEASRSDCLC